MCVCAFLCLLFGQIGAKKSKYLLFKIIHLHCLYIFRKIDKHIVELNKHK